MQALLAPRALLASEGTSIESNKRRHTFVNKAQQCHHKMMEAALGRGRYFLLERHFPGMSNSNDHQRDTS
jgi:hypothetical protein